MSAHFFTDTDGGVRLTYTLATGARVTRTFHAVPGTGAKPIYAVWEQCALAFARPVGTCLEPAVVPLYLVGRQTLDAVVRREYRRWRAAAPVYVPQHREETE